jgi:protein TonB
MIAKKNPKHDLEKRRNLYLNLGLLIAGSMTLVAFRFGTPAEKKSNTQSEKPSVTSEVFEVKPRMEQPKTEVQSKPEVQPIFIPDSAREQEKEPEKIIFTDNKLPEFVDFTTTKKGLGDMGLTGSDPIETIDIEFVQEYPEFPGGDAAMMNHIRSNFKFPNHIYSYEQGTVYVKFMVSSTGEIKGTKIERGISPEMDEEALRVVRSMPNWKPGKHRGRPVNVRMIIPIKIKYQ